MDKIRLTEQQLCGMIMEAVEGEISKRTAINRLYKIITPLTHGRFRDNDWSGVYTILDALEKAGYDVDVTVKDGGYRNSKGGNTLYAGSDASYWKEYNLKIPVGRHVINGILNCNACGSVDDPFDVYDVTVILW